jgi:putative hydrolase of the HAD superfamily
MIAALAFDLDDTLCLERDYVCSGFREVDRYLKERVDSERDWFWSLWQNFQDGVRGDAFNRVLAEAGVDPLPELVADLVQCYREHRPQIRPCDDVGPALKALGLPPEQLGLISDGPLLMQRRKWEALRLEGYMKQVLFTDIWGREFWKPNPRAFIEFEELTGCPPERCAYVSDNPQKDFRAPHERGWMTIRIIRPGGLHAAEPATPGEVDQTLSDLSGLLAALKLPGA